MQKLLNKFVKHYFRDIKTRLTFGIAIIVLISTLIIGLLFLTQYQRLLLKQVENDLSEKANKIAEVGSIFMSTTVPGPKEHFLASLRNMTDSDFWIIDNNGQVLITTNKIKMTHELLSKNQENVNSVYNKTSIINYDYSDYFNTKTLTVIVPIFEYDQLLGVVLVHKDVNIIYGLYTSLIILVIVSLIISFILSVFLGNFYSRHFTKPLKRLTEVANEIKNRNYNVLTNINQNDEIGELANTIDQMTLEIEKNIEEIKELENRAKELVANVSHEFKTPLTLIRGYTMNLQDKTIRPSKEVYEKIINNTKILEKLVNELLELSRYQSGNIVLNKEELSLKQLIDDVVADMNYLASTKQIEIEIDCDKDIIIEADYIKMRQLITIFLDNAIKYSNESGKVKITILENKIIIQDNGIGIEKSKLEQLFERYYQVNNNELGYGLGLCIAKYIADHHNFKIVIDSIENEGTIVRIELK